MSYTPQQFACPRHQRIEQLLERHLDETYRLAAHQHADLWRQELAEFNLKRHPVRVVELHGQPTLYVGDHLWFQYRPGHPLTDLLISIGATIDSAEWADHLFGEQLCTAKD